MKAAIIVLLVCLMCHGVLSVHPSTRVKKRLQFHKHCEICNIDFRVEDAWDVHLGSKRHAANALLWRTPEEIFSEFQQSAPLWAENCEVDDIAALFNREKELSPENKRLGLRFRPGGTLHPSQMVSKCEPYTKARLWRYLRHAIGPGHTAHYKEIATILAWVESQPTGFLRMKEIFESIESFRVIETFILAAQRTRAKMGLQPYNKIVELAAGHGLVGVLLAYRFGPGGSKNPCTVSLYDLHKRPFYDLLVEAFEKHGEKANPQTERVLPNIAFHEADVSLASSEIDDRSIVISVHGCNEINRDTIEMAMAKQAAWGVLPCCMRSDLYVGQTCTINLTEDERDVRHAIMCGSIAEKYQAQLIQEIDRRITNRAVFIGGGVDNKVVEETPHLVGTIPTRHEVYGEGELNRSARRKALPRLLMS